MPVIVEVSRLRQEDKEFKAGTEDMAQWLRPFVVLPEDPSLIPECTGIIF